MQKERMFMVASLLGGAVLAGCGADGAGSIKLTTWGEEYIEEEIPASELEDGWSFRYSKFLVVIGGIKIADEGGEVGAEMAGTRLFDHTSPGVKEVMTFADLEAKAWTRVSYEIRPAAGDTELGDGATADDLAMMRASGYAVYLEGQATLGAVTKSVQWGFSAPTAYIDCKGDKDGKETSGVIVTDGGTDAVELTIHGDHFFYDDLQAENAKLRFQSIADADTDGDGVVTQEELSALRLVDIDAANGAYGTGAAGDVNDLGAFVTSLSRTLGHFRGEGECFSSDPR